MFIPRSLSKRLKKRLKPNKVLLVTGARRVGKTELMKELATEIETNKVMILNGEDQDVQDALAQRSLSNYRRILGDTDLLIIDEAQVIPDIGKKLKLMVDELKGIRIIASGSSSFDLTNETGEPLTGRKYEMTLYPLAQQEISQVETLLDMRRNRDERLILGSYPELVNIESFEEKKEYLREIVNSYLLKDILTLGGIKKSEKLNQLLQLIARQVGMEVSYNELARSLGMSKNTVEKYLDLLSKVYVLVRLKGYSRNLRKEITKNDKWFFIDNGIRNAIINDFRLPSQRNDMGLLWENYILSERIKLRSFKSKKVDFHFWRTYDQQEIDFLEVDEKGITAFECKWGRPRYHDGTTFNHDFPRVRPPAGFARAYPDAEFNVVHPGNYLEFID